MSAPANMKVISEYSDEELKAYILGFNSALGVSSPNEEEKEYLFDIIKQAIVEYQSKSQKERDDWDAKVATFDGE